MWRTSTAMLNGDLVFFPPRTNFVVLRNRIGSSVNCPGPQRHKKLAAFCLRGMFNKSFLSFNLKVGLKPDLFGT